MSSFKTNSGLTFTLNIRTKDIDAVRDNVRYPDGKPVDILEAAETGTLAGIYGDVKTLVDTVFFLCLPQIKEHFDLQEYDRESEWEYELHPDRKKESAVIKASRWFGAQVDGDVLMTMKEAFYEAAVNFIPNENRRQAMRLIIEKEKEMERMETELQLKTVETLYGQAADRMRERYNAAAAIPAGAENLSGSTPE